MLFSPVTINKTEFRNRIIFPPMLTRFAASGGEMSDQLMHYHAARAAGGAGLNMLEATCVHPSGICFESGLSIYDDRHIRGLSRFTAAIHAAGGSSITGGCIPCLPCPAAPCRWFPLFRA